MRRYSSILLLSALTTLVHCSKTDNNDPVGCLGCGIDTSSKLKQFEITGQLVQNCGNMVGAERTIELYDHTNTLFFGPIRSNSDGTFTISYSKLVDWPYTQTPQLSPPNVIRIVEDSVWVIIPALTNFKDLTLALNDSMAMDVRIYPGQNTLGATDTIYYQFAPDWVQGVFGVKTPLYKANGPFSIDSLYSHAATPWRIIELDEQGLPILKVYWERQPHFTNSSTQQWVTSKEPCVMRRDIAKIIF